MYPYMKVTLLVPSSLMQWLALWFCDPQVVRSNPVDDAQGYELFREIAL